jgi:TolB protein
VKFLFLAAVLWAQSEVHINVGGGAKLPVHKIELSGLGDLRDIVRDDLLFSRYFEVVEEGQGAPWKVEGQLVAGGGKLLLDAKLVEQGSKEPLFARHYKQEAAYQRSLAHKLADDIVHAVTGKKGIAHSQIAFINNKTGSKEVYVVDYDGENLRQLTRHGSITLLPRWSPDRRRIAYTSYKDGNPDLWLLDLANGQTTALSSDQGLNISGGFSDDGGQLLMTLSRQKSPNLYLKNLVDGSVTRLTHHFGADSSPTFSPDAAQVAFVSDRSGNPQIYVLDMSTHRARRLTNMNWCDSPSWSPTGEWIAFSGRAHNKDKMDIFLVDVTGTQVRQLTRVEGSNENPTWSPDGRFLAFTTTRNGRPELYVMDADGSAPHKVLAIPGSSVTPDWSR